MKSRDLRVCKKCRHHVIVEDGDSTCSLEFGKYMTKQIQQSIDRDIFKAIGIACGTSTATTHIFPHIGATNREYNDAMYEGEKLPDGCALLMEQSVVTQGESDFGPL